MNRLDSTEILFFPIPRGRAAATWITTLFVLGTCGVALRNIMNWKSLSTSGWLGAWPLAASGLWLVLVAALLWGIRSGCGSIGRSLLGLLGGFARREFLACYPGRDDSHRLARGFTFFGRRIVLDDIALDQLEQVDWNTGQASARAGHDVSDWGLFLWYRRVDNGREKIWHIASPGHKEQAYARGRELIDWLRRAGSVDLVPGKSDHVFVRPGAEMLAK